MHPDLNAWWHTHTKRAPGPWALQAAGLGEGGGGGSSDAKDPAHLDPPLGQGAVCLEFAQQAAIGSPDNILPHISCTYSSPTTRFVPVEEDGPRNIDPSLKTKYTDFDHSSGSEITPAVPHNYTFSIFSSKDRV